MTKPGWYPDDSTDEVVRYWDGTAWLQERHWDGKEWVERPLGTPIAAAAAAAAAPPPAAVIPEPEPAPPPDAFVDVAPPPPPPDAFADVPPPAPPPPPPDAFADVPPPAPPPDAVVAPTATVVGGPVTASPVNETVVGAPLPDVATPAVAAAAAVPPPDAPVTAPPPTAPLTVTVPPGPGSTRSGWHRPAALVALGVVVAVASGAITYLVRKNDDGTSAIQTQDVASTSSTRALRTSTTTSTSTSTTTITTPFGVPPATPAAVVGTVANTCGADGRGDCFVAVRTGPSGSAPEVTRVNDGQPIFVVCQVPGSSVHSTKLGQSSIAWSRTSDGNYAASIFVDAPGFDPLRVSVPCP